MCINNTADTKTLFPIFPDVRVMSVSIAEDLPGNHFQQSCFAQPISPDKAVAATEYEMNISPCD